MLLTGDDQKSIYKRIAFLHKQSIVGGFLAGLSYQVLIQLYHTIAVSPHSLLWVFFDDENQVQGFISLSFSTSKLYREFIIKKSLFILPYLITKIISIEFLRKMYEVLIYPIRQVEISMPKVELLNFCVDESKRGQNIGSELFLTVEKELKSRNINTLKIVTGETQKGAQNFYEKRGAQLLARQIIHKGSKSFIYQYEIN